MIVHEADPEPALIVYPARKRTTTQAMICGIFAVIGILIAALGFAVIASGENAGLIVIGIGLLGGGLFAWGLRAASRERRDPSPALLVTRDGIVVMRSRDRGKFVSWDHVKGFTIKTRYGGFGDLEIDVRDAKSIIVPPAVLSRGTRIERAGLLGLTVPWRKMPMPARELVPMITAFQPAVPESQN